MPFVYLVIVNYKNWQDTAACLHSILLSDYDDYKIFVVDNASGNNSIEHLEEWANTIESKQSATTISFSTHSVRDLQGNINFQLLPQLNFIKNDENKGFAAGNNIILQYLLNADVYVWLLNPDMVVEKNTMSALVSFALKNAEKSIVGNVVKYNDAPAKIHFLGGAKINFNSATVNFIRNKNDLSGVDFICGGSMFTHASAFNDIGLLPEEYFLYWEETDWCFSAKQKGYQLLVCLNAVCYDKISTTIGKGFYADYYYTRNGLLFVSKYKQKKIAIALSLTSLRVMKRLFFGEWQRARGVYKGMMAFLTRSK